MHDDGPRPYLQGLGVIAHGPQVLSEGPGVGIGLRCIFAYPEGLLISFQVTAVGQAVIDVYIPGWFTHPGPRGAGATRSDPQFAVLNLLTSSGEPSTLQGFLGSTSVHGSAREAQGTPVYVDERDYWLPELPDQSNLTLQAGWPEAGAPVRTTTLPLDGLDRPDLAGRIVTLR